MGSKIKFGIDVRRKLTGADIYVKTMQLACILVLPYVFLATSYQVVLTNKNVFSVLFDLGLSTIPRWAALGLSFVYRLTSSEIWFFFVMMALALIFGIICNRILHGERTKAIKSRKVFMILIVIDLVLRLIPLSFNVAFGLPTAILGFVIRLACLALIYMDLKAGALEKQQ
ncbi:MAG: hypothetical protein J6Q41_08600 [Firmicutes bacterium]|nr:hypothetical protein [Bacillota bacterium]